MHPALLKRLLVLLLAIMSIDALIINDHTLASWSANVSRFFANEITNKMRIQHLQQTYDTTPRSTVSVNGAVELAGSIVTVQTLLQAVVGDLDDLVEDISKQGHPSFTKKRQSSSSLYRYFSHATNGSVILEENTNSRKLIDSTDLLLSSMDGRLTPWYSNAVAGPKHVFVIVDPRIEAHTSEADRTFFLQRLIAAALSIISTTSPFDTLHLRTVTAQGDLADPLLSCSGNGGLLESMTEMIGVIENLSTIVLQKITPGDRNIWSSVLRSTFRTVELVFKNAAAKNEVGAVLLLSALKPEGSGYLERNTHNLPVMTFNIPTPTKQQTAKESFVEQSCSNLGLTQNIATLQEARDVGRYYESIVDVAVSQISQNAKSEPNSTLVQQSSSLSFWGGLFASKEPMIFTFARPVFQKRDKEATYVLLGVACVDASLRMIKNLLDVASQDMGRLSFASLVTVQGKTIYHPVLNKYQSIDLVDVGVDIGDLEWYDGFAELVREPLLNGETGSSPIIKLIRSFKAGDLASKIVDQTRIDTRYFYGPIPTFPLRLFFAFDTSELERVTFNPQEATPTIQSSIAHFDNGLNNDITSKVPYFSIINQDNCMDPDNASSVPFNFCKPDKYCALQEQNLPQPLVNSMSAPPCVTESTCVCEPHRWSVGTLVTGTVAHFSVSASHSIADPTFEWTPQLSGDVMRYVLRMDSAKNPKELSLRDSIVSQVDISLKATEIWNRDKFSPDHKTNVHNDTIWLYLSNTFGTSVIFPGNNWGTKWDGTRRPWFKDCAKSVERRQSEPYAVVSTPYIDTGGAGMVATLTAAIWNFDTQPLDLQSKHQIFAVVGFDFAIGVVNYLQDLSDGACGSSTTFCVLLNTYGLVVFHPDFQRGQSDRSGGKPVYNTFLGLREPDLADSLIENKLLYKLKNTRSADSKTLTTMFRLNEKKISDLGGVASGTLDSDNLKCLKSPGVGAPPIKWYLSQVARSNTALLVVDGYIKKSGTCLHETLADPPTERIRTSCGSSGSSPLTSSVTVDRLIRAPPSDKRLFHKCAKCKIGFYGSSMVASFLVVGTDVSVLAQEGKKDCTKCPSGYITATVGLRSCSLCELGKISAPASEDCNSCPHGKTSDTDSIVCNSCPSGWFAVPRIGLNALSVLNEPSYCQTCPKGWYQDKAGTKFCIRCPPDTFGPSDGSYSSTQCLHCDAERTTESSVLVLETSNVPLSSSPPTFSASSSTATSAKSAVVLDTKSKEDDVCFCKGVTDEERKAAQNQYTDNKYLESVLKIYGGRCEQWDNLIGSPNQEFCPPNVDVCVPHGNWCSQHWCYVNDPEACAARGFDVVPSTVFATANGEPNAFYSYEICGYPNCFDVSKLTLYVHNHVGSMLFIFAKILFFILFLFFFFLLFFIVFIFFIFFFFLLLFFYFFFSFTNE